MKTWNVIFCLSADVSATPDRVEFRRVVAPNFDIVYAWASKMYGSRRGWKLESISCHVDIHAILDSDKIVTCKDGNMDV